MNPQDDISPELKQLLDELKTLPPRDPQTAARGRTQFLARAYSLRQGVSEKADPRLKWWNVFTFRKDRFAMNTIFALFLATALLFGGAGTTVYAAQDDLPNAPLYPVKIGVEDISLWFNTDPLTEVNMLMQMTQARAQEMLALSETGDEIPDLIHLRLQLQIHDALCTAATLEDPEMEQALLQIQAALQTQDQLMTQAQLHATDDTLPLLTQTRDMLQTRIRLVEDGLADPAGFRNTVRNEEQNQYWLEPTATPLPETPEPEATPAAVIETEPALDNSANGNEQTTQNGTGGNEDAPSQQNGNDTAPQPSPDHQGPAGPGAGGNGGGNKP